MGILAMNIVGFAMPYPAYTNPLAYGAEGPADLVAWLISFVLFDGKMRGLFSFLFGASMLLVIERADAAGLPSATIHFRRMAWLFLFGLVHLYLIWFGDILSLYAPVGMIAWFFYWRSPRSLAAWGLVLLLVQLLLLVTLTQSYYKLSAAAAAPGADAKAIAAWARMKVDLAIPSPAVRSETLALYRGGYLGIVRHTLEEELATPVKSLLFLGWETLAYMLFGMAALKTRFLSGGWTDARYCRVALIGFGIGIPVQCVLAWLLWTDDFSVPRLFALSVMATVLVRPLLIVATAALVILLTRRQGALTRRIAAAGRAAFSNYLGTSIVMALLFYGFGLGLYGTISRAGLWFVVVPAWALMLLWSKPWLDRFRYGPFEWLWRSLARGTPQPMRIA